MQVFYGKSIMLQVITAILLLLAQLMKSELPSPALTVFLITKKLLGAPTQKPMEQQTNNKPLNLETPLSAQNDVKCAV